MNKLSPTHSVINLLKQGKSLENILEEVNLPSLGAYIFEFICKTNCSVEVIAGFADLNKTSLYRILNGEINPHRNVLLRLSRVLNMNIDETQQLLKCGNVALLSGRRPRDVVIMDGIIHNNDIADINENLEKHKMPDLFSKK